MIDIESIPFLEVVLTFTVVVYFLHSYLDARQYKALKLPSPPASVASLFKDDLYKKTQSYSLDKWWFGLFHGIFDLIQSLAILAFGVLPWGWKQTGSLLGAIKIGANSEIVHTIVFLLAFSLVGMVIDLPWSLYQTFVLEERHGFNKQTLGLFLMDMLKKLVLGLILVPPVIAGITYILMNAGAWLPIYLWGFAFGLSIFFLTIYPIFIAPLFNKFVTLEDGSLKTKIEELAASLQFPLKRLYQIDGSKRSAHSNAYMYGFFNNKRIVLFDTLIEQCTEEEVVAVLAHELGHWKLAHTVKLFVASQVIILGHFLLFTFIRNSNALFESFGFHDAKPAFMSFVLFQYISSPLDEVIGFLQNAVSRTFEFQADDFAVKLGHADKLMGALIRLEEENKGALNVDPWYSAYHYSHPPLPERIQAIREGSKKKE